MDIVIKLPDKDYQVMLTKVMLACRGCEIIELPKGHGDLIDRSRLEVHYVGTDIGTDCPVYLLPTVEEAPTIIEADTGK